MRSYVQCRIVSLRVGAELNDEAWHRAFPMSDAGTRIRRSSRSLLQHHAMCHTCQRQYFAVGRRRRKKPQRSRCNTWDGGRCQNAHQPRHHEGADDDGRRTEVGPSTKKKLTHLEVTNDSAWSLKGYDVGTVRTLVHIPSTRPGWQVAAIQQRGGWC